MGNRKDWSGLRWKTIHYFTIDKYFDIVTRKDMVPVRCICGMEKLVRLANILTWGIKSCWCMKSKMISDAKKKHWMHMTHGIYNIFQALKGRCNRKAGKDYPRYWGRWIKCLRKSFEEFYEDMWPTYKEWLQIDRIDNNWHYSKENCRRVTAKENCNNRGNNRLLLYKWFVYTLSQLSEKIWMHRGSLIYRVKHWIIKDIQLYH